MKVLELEQLEKWKDYLIIDLENFKIVFTTAEKDRSFNRATEEGVANLNELKSDFEINEIAYIRQIHSDKVHIYDKGDKDFIELEGDAIVSKVVNTAIGVFTADCVPIVLVAKESKVVAAIHSGWRGTYNSIIIKTINTMIDKLNVSLDEIEVIIGPHIRQCCYQVSEELKIDFLNSKNRYNNTLFKDRNLSLENYIVDDLLIIGIKPEKITSINLCTHCEDDIKLFSYRKSIGTYGRMFTFVIVKDI